MSVDFWVNVGVLAGIYGILTLGSQVNAGFTGLLNFGQAGFMAIGAYGVGVFVVSGGLPLWLAFLLALGLSVAAALVVGLSMLRLRADYFAIVTIAFAEIVRYTLQNSEFSGGNQGLIGFDANWREASGWMSSKLVAIGLGDHQQIPLFLAVWSTLLMLTLLLKILERTPWSRVLRAIREDEEATAALGKNTLSYKLQSLVLAAALAAVAGFFVALDVTYLYPSIFDPTFTFFGYAILLVGGLGSYWGVAVGSILFWSLLEGSRLFETELSATQQASLRFIVVGLLLIVLGRLGPQGIFGSRKEMRARL
ncbi:branched-chain amino acid ABC transporter permease [Rhizobium sp. Root1220]|uniref:branched-chain amino acid ABC transporter permease n=1 Tax=Rhizobium sp. Root1220 TaxID=1736432 RepID=UPI0006FBA185|nr:branched-chain amino acid ABC transporter permease [Rhizobium sp. Root1220]KQV64626.1 ABC transporter permease [Rhizobium sp. Root1220]